MTTASSGSQDVGRSDGAPRRVAVLGASGSIGTQALDLCRRHPDLLDVVGLAVARSVETLISQAEEFRPDAVCVTGDAEIPDGSLPAGTRVLRGEEGLVAMAGELDADIVLNGVVGAAGLRASLAALKADRVLALANKESIVAGGPVVRRAVDAGRGRIVPVDSEHAASAQLLRGEVQSEVSRLVLTASGGPFRGRTRDDLAGVTVDEALKHPTWDMGAKITIDSATLFNKGLEVIEAHYLFDLEMERIGVVVHPQSIVHAVLEMCDGSAKAQVGLPDMRQPIGWALMSPERLHDPIGQVRWHELPPLVFEEPDLEAFPALAIAFEAGRLGGTATAVLNAANEVAVGAFLEGRCGFLDIPRVVEEVLSAHEVVDPRDVDDVLEADARARSEAARRLG